MKAATTTVRDLLDTHPQIYLAQNELHYFTGDRPNRDLAWYEKQFQEAGNAVAVGEKSPSYCYEPNAAGRIAKLLGDVRLIFVLREPVARAYSNYWHHVTYGMERRSFEAAVDLELSRNRRSIWQMYLKRSRYIEQVERLLNFFPRESLKIVLFEEFSREPHRVLTELCGFLGVPDSARFDVQRRANTTRIPVSKNVAWLTRRTLGTGRIAQAVGRLNRRRAAGYPEMGDAIRERLHEHFAPFNAELAQRAGVDLAVWDP